MLDGASLTPKAPLAVTSGKAQVFNVGGHLTIIRSFVVLSLRLLMGCF